MRKKIPIDKIQPSPFQPRQTFDEEKLAELAQSIEEIDLLEPIILRHNGESDDYELIAGERRWRACQKAGLKEIEAIVYTKISDFEAMLISGSENIHREDLTSVERENLITSLWKKGEKAGEIKTKTELARKLGLSKYHVDNVIQAKQFRDSMLLGSSVSTRSIIHTRGLPTEERKQVLKRIVKEEIPARNIQKFVSVIKSVSPPIRQALLTPGSKITPEIATQIDRRIQTEKGKQQAIFEIQKYVSPSIESVEDIIEDTKERERQQLELGKFTEIEQPVEKEESREFPIRFYPHKHLDGTEEFRVSKVSEGSIIEVFSATPNPKNLTDVICPHFMKLKWSLGCPYECAWCYLQGTLRFQPEKTKPQFKDRELIARDIERFCKCVGTRAEILNTGELSDSLMGEKQDPPFSQFIIDLIKAHRGDKSHKVLFLSKSSNIRHLLKSEGQDVAICSFTLNALPVAKRWEKLAASVENRLKAAKQLKDAGYEVRLRIDPMVPIEDWKTAYIDLADMIFEHLMPDRITLGSLRGLQSTINNARDKTWTKYLEERSNWGLKIPFKMRFEMYRTIIDHFKEKWNFSEISLCKETSGMWLKLGMDGTHPKCNCVE